MITVGMVHETFTARTNYINSLWYASITCAVTLGMAYHGTLGMCDYSGDGVSRYSGDGVSRVWLLWGWRITCVVTLGMAITCVITLGMAIMCVIVEIQTVAGREWMALCG